MHVTDVLGAAELYAEKRFKWYILCHVYFATIKRNNKHKGKMAPVRTREMKSPSQASEWAMWSLIYLNT